MLSYIISLYLNISQVHGWGGGGRKGNNRTVEKKRVNIDRAKRIYNRKTNKKAKRDGNPEPH